MFNIETLRSKTDAELNKISEDLAIKIAKNSSQDEVVFAILDYQASNTKQITAYLNANTDQNAVEVPAEEKPKAPAKRGRPAKKPLAIKNTEEPEASPTQEPTESAAETVVTAEEPMLQKNPAPAEVSAKPKRGRKPKVAAAKELPAAPTENASQEKTPETEMNADFGNESTEVVQPETSTANSNQIKEERKENPNRNPNKNRNATQNSDGSSERINAAHKYSEGEDAQSNVEHSPKPHHNANKNQNNKQNQKNAGDGTQEANKNLNPNASSEQAQGERKQNLNRHPNKNSGSEHPHKNGERNVNQNPNANRNANKNSETDNAYSSTEGNQNTGRNPNRHPNAENSDTPVEGNPQANLQANQKQHKNLNRNSNAENGEAHADGNSNGNQNPNRNPNQNPNQNKSQNPNQEQAAGSAANSNKNPNQHKQKEAPQQEQKKEYSFDGLVTIEGVLEILPDNYGFLRSSDFSYISSPDDVYVSTNQIRNYGLKTGDNVKGIVRLPKEGEKYFSLQKPTEVNGRDLDFIKDRVAFEYLTPLFPEEKFNLAEKGSTKSTRIVDLFAPIGKGQRAMIVAQPKTGKTMLLKEIANAISSNHPEAYMMVLLIDERPEEVTDMERSVNAEVIASTFDESAEKHVKVANLVLAKAQRMVECGHDVVILLDSITRLARAYNTVTPASGKILSGGVDANALHKPKRFFGAARKIEGGGSLTIIATALIDTGSKMDEVIFEEFKGTGNMELQLDRKIANKRIFPAIDLVASSTRRDDLLHDPVTQQRMWILRKHLADMNPLEAMQFVEKNIKQSINNEEFLMSMNK